MEQNMKIYLRFYVLVIDFKKDLNQIKMIYFN